MIYFKMVDGKKIYTLSNVDSELAMPAKYSVEDKFSMERIEMKKRYNIFPFNE